MMQLHLGCGPRVIPGYTQIDIEPRSNVDIVADAGDLHMLRDGCASTIYACHVLEHFPMARVPAVLAEWRRLLCRHGTLRVAVPDFRALVELYTTHGKALPIIAGPILGGQKSEHDAHLSIYDEETLTALLTLARFTDIRRYDAQHTAHADVDDYAQARIFCVPISLNMEATKP